MTVTSTKSHSTNKNIAVIGSGIAGLTSANLLSKKHQVTLFEANNYLGGHTHTVEVSTSSGDYSIDTGFIVFNNKTYPNFLKLLANLGVDKQATEMSFSVLNMTTGLEYNGHSFSSLFSQRRNIINPRFYCFLREILRFNRLSKQALKNTVGIEPITLGAFLKSNRFSTFFENHYILPMVAAIWSSSMADARKFPLAFFLHFFENHGLLDIVDRPQWYVIKGGSNSYIPALIKNIHDVRLESPVSEIKRNNKGITIVSTVGEEHFDEVVLACHSDQALQLLGDKSEDERRILGNLEYRTNEVVLHTDTRLLPKYKKSWASWNYLLDDDPESLPSVTYNMNILQGIKAPETFCVTLNPNVEIKQEKIIGSYSYSHPVYNQKSIDAQQQRSLICGHNRTHFCGAYWYNGFHEDGVRSALDVCQRFGVTL